MIVMGGPPSVGSSLLVRILDRHPSIVAGPETAVFARTSLMTDWNRDKSLLVHKSWRKLRDHGWHRYRGTTLLDEYYPWDKVALTAMVDSSPNFEAFIQQLESKLHTHYYTSIWIEKTPSNAYNFGWLRNDNPDTKLIMMVRNPYDAIASMIDRGFSVLYATAAYLLHGSAGFMGPEENIHYLKYEDLVHHTEPTMSELCNYVGVVYNPKMLTADQDEVIMKGWLQSESGSVGDKSINRFDNLPPTLQAEVINCAASLRVNHSFQLPYLNWGFDSIEEICEHWGYTYKIPTGKYNKRKHQIELCREAYIRTLSLYPTHLFNYPLSYHI